MFRTFDANILLLERLIDHKEIEKITTTNRKKIIVQEVKGVSECINNTASICKKSYIDPSLIDMFINSPNKFKKYFIKASGSIIERFINYIDEKK